MNGRRTIGGLCLLWVAFAAQANADRLSTIDVQTLPAGIEALRLDTPLRVENAMGIIDPEIANATGPQQIVVRLSSPPTASLGASDRAAAQEALRSEQAAFISRHQSADVRVIGQVQHVMNAVFLEVSGDAMQTLANDPMVTRVVSVGSYEMDLTETVPYIGAAAVQATGLTGEGISVAVLDSGVDYTHADLGGSGDPADYLANDGTIIEPGTFPTAKVVGGFDFLGNQWPNGPILPDPDPLDDLAQVPGAFAGHGTHVADIIGGVNGVAPGADIYAVKVCASLASSCNGIALILGMEFSVDPNGDGDTSDHVDIINMSLGATYGQPFDDDLSAAVDAASMIGTLTVASAGNCGDRPYCTGTPAAAPTALSVAQTAVPSARLYFMNVVEPAFAAGLYNAVRYSWTPEPAELIEGTVIYADGQGNNLNGCAPFEADLTGQIVMVDRGGCFFSDKIRNIENAGGILGIVGLVAPGAPFNGGFGGGSAINIPGFNIDEASANIIRAGGAVVQFGPELSQSLAGSTVSSTARGPDMSFNAIKPEIGAPGASVSAEVGTGTLRTPFGGTSGAAPMVSGSAALLLEACLAEQEGSDYEWDPYEFDYTLFKGNRAHYGEYGMWGFGKTMDCSPMQLKAMLMNRSDSDIASDTTGGSAEITRIGAGEVRADAAASAGYWAYSPDDDQASLSLGLISADDYVSIKREVKLVSNSIEWQWINVTPTFRNAPSGAVSVEASTSGLWLPPYSTSSVFLRFKIDPTLLGGNTMSSGSDGGNPAALSAAEVDGYLRFESPEGGNADMPWHAIPRKSAKLWADSYTLAGGDEIIDLYNVGAGDAQLDAFSIIALSDERERGTAGQQQPTPDLRAVGISTIPVPPGFCSGDASFLWVFGSNTWERQTHLLPVSMIYFLDTNQDGLDDYAVLNRDLSGLGTIDDGRQVSWVLDLATGDTSAFFFASHATNSGNTSLTICGEQIGMNAADFLTTQVDVDVWAQDFYNGGPFDIIEDLTITPLGERYLTLTSDIPGGGMGQADIRDFGALEGNTKEYGVMIMTDGDRGAGNRGGATEDSEAALLLAPSVTPPAPLN